MDVYDPKARLGYRYGARDAVEACSHHMPTEDKRAMLVWLKDLEKWNGAAPPPAPRLWSRSAEVERNLENRGSSHKQAGFRSAFDLESLPF